LRMLWMRMVTRRRRSDRRQFRQVPGTRAPSG